MFQDIVIREVAQFKEEIRMGFVSRKGVVVAVDWKGGISLFCRGNEGRVEELHRCLEEQYSFKFRRCWEIREDEEASGDATVLVLGLDRSICVVRISLVESEGNGDKLIPRIQNIELVEIVKQELVSGKVYSVNLVGIRNNIIALTLHIHKTSLAIKAYQIHSNYQSFSLSPKINTILACQQTVPHNFHIFQEMLMFSFPTRWFSNYLFLYSQMTFDGSANKLIIVDLRKCTEEQYQIEAAFHLVDNDSLKILKEVYLVPSDKPVEEGSLLLFFQHPRFLEIVEVSMTNPSTPLKHVQHPSLILYQIISCSMTPLAIELKGQDYCQETLNFLIQGKTSIHGQDKLMIVPAPFSFKPDRIINHITLPCQLLCIHPSQVICSTYIYELSLTPKHCLYQQLLSPRLNDHPLQRLILQLLD